MAAPTGSHAVETVDVHAAKDLIRSGHLYMDVRKRFYTVGDLGLNQAGIWTSQKMTAEEFKQGHLENALNVPYMFSTPQGRVKNPEFLEQVSSVCQKDDHIVVGCQSGVRSLHAAVDLLSADFKNIKNMGGGYAAWVEKGFTVEKPKVEL